MSRIPVGLQMYTVRDEAARDYVGSLRRVAEMGYEGAELAGTGGFTAAELRRLLDDFGLRLAGSHVPLDKLEGDLGSALDFIQELGTRYVICPWLPEDRRKSADDYRRVAESLNRAGAVCKERGLQLCYHNHAFEFEEFDGRPALDLLFDSTDPELVQSELDTYWVEYGGKSAVEYIRKLSGRVPLVHLKDMAKDESRTFAEVGEGRLDWQAIFPACEAAGVQWYLVEQDKCARPPFESAQISLDNLRRWGIAAPRG